MSEPKLAAWEPATCRVPMWMGGCPAGFCDRPAFGPQLPRETLWNERGWGRGDVPYCHGHCCPAHGGPREGDPIIFHDGLTKEGRQMWCAVMPGFVDLQASAAGFDGNPIVAVRKLREAIARSEPTPSPNDRSGA